MARSDGNVVPFPRDWLGPREELVPIGRPARDRPPDPTGEDDLPPAAEAFWSEDSAALHDAVQGPSHSFERLAPPASARQPARGRLKWGFGAIAAMALAVLAVIGSVEQPPGKGRTPPHRHVLAAGIGEQAQFESAASTILREDAKSALAVHQITHARARTTAAHHARPRPVSRRSVRHVVSHVTAVTPSQGSDAATSQPVTQPVASTPPSSSSEAGSSSSTPSEQTATSAPTTAFGSNGLLGPGSSPNS